MMRIPCIHASLLLVAFILTACSHASNHDGVRSMGYIGDGDYAPSPAVRELLSEHALVTPGGHAYLYLKKGDGKERPPKEAIADIHLRILDAANQIVNEDDTTITLNQASHILEDMVTHMVIGDKVRVWGDSFLRVWEIELIDFRVIPNEPVKEIAPDWPRYPEQGTAKERITKHVDGDKIQKDQFIHIQKTLWKSFENQDELQYIVSYDEIVQVNPLAIFESEYNTLISMSVGERVRRWHPQKPGYPTIVSDIWVLDRYPQYETPENLELPEDKSYRLSPGLYKQIIYHDKNAKIIEDNEQFSIQIHCWDTEKGYLVATSDINYGGKHALVENSMITYKKLKWWRELVELEMRTESAYSWCAFIDPQSPKGQECQRMLQTEHTFDEMERHRIGNKTYKYRLSFHWKSLLKDAAFGDVFMAWISHIVLRDSDRALDSMHPDHYLNLTCRVKVDHSK